MKNSQLLLVTYVIFCSIYMVEGREGDELADVELRPEQVTVCGWLEVRRAQLRERDM